MEHNKLFSMPFSTIYPLYIAKAQRKGRTQEEVDDIIFWLTGYEKGTLEKAIAENLSLEKFFHQAPQINPKAKQIKGLICGHRVEEITDPLLQKIRYLDKLIDQLAKGKSLEKIFPS